MEFDTRFLSSGFFHESVSPRPLSMPMGLFQMFTKICVDIHNFVVITGVIKLFTSVNKTGDKLFVVLLLPAINYGRVLDIGV